ncbi:hypothetical protein CB1_000223024 [Camelus ferus]|nr:hypothetical protein CB1_000223024 [Camelus ferus]
MTDFCRSAGGPPEPYATVSETAPEDVFPKVTDGQCKGDLDYDSCGDEQIHAWRGPGVYSRAQTPTGRRLQGAATVLVTAISPGRFPEALDELPLPPFLQPLDLTGKG